MQKAISNLREKSSNRQPPMPMPTEIGLLRRLIKNNDHTPAAPAAVGVRPPRLFQGPPTVEIQELFDRGFVTKPPELVGKANTLNVFSIDNNYTCDYYETDCHCGKRVYLVLRCENTVVTTEVQCTSLCSPGSNVDEVTITKFLVADYSAAQLALQCLLRLYANSTCEVVFQYNVHRALGHDATVNDDMFETKILSFLGLRASKDTSLSRLTFTIPAMRPWLGIKNPSNLCATIAATQLLYALFR